MATLASQLELLPIKECEQYFTEKIEGNLGNFEDSDNLPLLRACLDLLSRLDGSNHCNFSGKILIFLAKLLPLFDRSGLNPTSEVNIKNLPTQVTETLRIFAAKNSSKDEFERDIEEGEALENDEEIVSEDADKLYERFWKIQNYLSQPSLLHDKNAWYSFRTHTDSLLTYMVNFPSTTAVWKINSSFAINSKALNMQLSDQNFRRCLLLQLLFILRSDRGDKEAQSSWANVTITSIYNILGRLPDQVSGKKFVDCIQQLFKREGMWEQWKTDKCPNVKAINDDEIVSMRSTYSKKRKLADEIKTAKQYNLNVIGSSQLTKLWNLTDNEKFNTPTLDKFLEPTLNESPEKNSEIFKDASYGFRALRLLSKKSSTFVIPSTKSVKPLNEYLTAAVENMKSREV